MSASSRAPDPAAERLTRTASESSVSRSVKHKKAGGIAAVKPINIVEEQAKFAQDCKYNPQFRYKDRAAAAQVCGSISPKHEFVDLAIAVLETVISRYGSESAYLTAAWGEVLSRPECDAIVQDYLNSYGLTKHIRVSWSPGHLVTAFSKSPSKDPTTGKRFSGGCLQLVSRPGYYRRFRLLGLLDHEIGTHFLRAHNARFDPCPRVKTSYFTALATEEGLASLNTHQWTADKLLFQPALLYWSAWRASVLGFSDLNQEMCKYVDSPDRRWLECVRVKRGLQDTSRPGGYAKDQAAWDGLVRILWHRRNLDVVTIHLSKVSLEQLAHDAAHQAAGGRPCAREAGAAEAPADQHSSHAADPRTAAAREDSRDPERGRVATLRERSLAETEGRTGPCLPKFVLDEAAYRNRLDQMAASNGLVGVAEAGASVDSRPPWGARGAETADVSPSAEERERAAEDVWVGESVPPDPDAMS